MITASEDTEALLRSRRRSPIELFVIGCSTGGPTVLHTIIPALPADFPAPVLIVQHMPVGYVKPLALELDRSSKVRVGVASHRLRIAPGEVWIAPADHHMTVRYRSHTELETLLSDEPPLHGCRPAVDPLAISIGKVVGKRAALIVLTGMGHDGQFGAQAVRSSGGLVVAQDADSSQVFGMPRAVIEDDTAQIVLDSGDIADFMCAAAERRITRQGGSHG